MFAVALGIYVLIMAFIWGFFLVAKVHFFKFKEYSNYIAPATKFVMSALVVLTLLGGYFVYRISGGPAQSTQTVEETQSNEVY